MINKRNKCLLALVGMIVTLPAFASWALTILNGTWCPINLSGAITQTIPYAYPPRPITLTVPDGSLAISETHAIVSGHCPSTSTDTTSISIGSSSSISQTSLSSASFIVLAFTSDVLPNSDIFPSTSSESVGGHASFINMQVCDGFPPCTTGPTSFANVKQKIK